MVNLLGRNRFHSLRLWEARARWPRYKRGAIRVLRDIEVASTSDIMPITHPQQLNPQHRSRSLRRVLDEIAVKVGRDGGQGCPILWKLRPEFREPR